MPTTIILVRHGETDWNRERRFQGHADTALNESGRQQAVALADALSSERLTAICTSPLRRASETADIVGARLGLQPEKLAALREIDVGDWQGLTVDEVKARFPDEARVAWHAGWPNGETYDQLGARVLPALNGLEERHPDGRVLGVTHAGPIRAAVAAAAGISVEESRERIGRLENCAVFRFVVRDARLVAVDVD